MEKGVDIVGRFEQLSKTAQNLILMGTVVTVTVTASAATFRYIAIPDNLAEMDTQHSERMNAIESRQNSFESAATAKLDNILRSIKSLDLRLCLEQAFRDGTDPRECGQPNQNSRLP